MTDRYDNVDLTQLPAPAVVETIDVEALKAAALADFKIQAAAVGLTWDMEAIEGEPASVNAEMVAYREFQLRQRVNDAARAVMLPYATGSDLDNLAAFWSVLRAPGETDTQFRYRVQLAPESLSTAGARGAYEFFARGVFPSDVQDVQVFSPKPGQVHVIPLTISNDGVPSTDLLGRIHLALDQDTVVPLTDSVYVRAPRRIPFDINAVLIVNRGPDLGLLLATATATLSAYLSSRRQVGKPVYLAGIYAALKVAGVEDVVLNAPTSNVIPLEDQVAIPTLTGLATAFA